MAGKDYQSLEYEPTWVIAAVCAIIVLISLSAERGLHRLGKFLKHKHQGALFEALEKLKEELMLLGFISLLLTVFQAPMRRICVPGPVLSHLLPCKKDMSGSEKNSHLLRYSESTRSRRRLLSEGSDSEHCAHQGKVPLISLEAIDQLHIFIFTLAVVYVFFCATTVVLGGMKVRRWKHWEDSMRREFSKSETGTRIEEIHRVHHQKFKQRAEYSSFISWIVSFFKQFYGSLTKSDYIALRRGFIMTHCPSYPTFDFHKYMMRTLLIDFKKVVAISWYLWAFVVLFLLLNLKGWHTYFWLSFLPLILLLLVGAKLDNIITSLAEEIVTKSMEGSEEKNGEGDVQDEGKPWVKPSDKHFWFNRPHIVLYLIHFILFQNSFEIAFLLWVLCTYGIKSCIVDKVGFVIPRLVIGVIVQVICSYSTLPLYTIVTQMGSKFKKGFIDEQIHEAMHDWAQDTMRRGAVRKNEMQRLNSEILQAVPESSQSAVTLEG